MKKHKKTVSLPKLHFLTVSVLLIISGYFQSVADAQTRNAQSGEIAFEGEDKKTSISSSKESAYTYITEAATKLKVATSAISLPSDNDISYFNGVYLYCTINNGTCPLALDALYEIDLLNAYHSKKAECPILTRFWKMWLSNGFEDRQRYMVKTAYISATSSFSLKERPQYIKCADSIKTSLSSLSTDPQEFKARFGGTGTGTTVVTKFSEMIKMIRDNGIDVFAAMGITGTKETTSGTAKTKKK